jgi:SAM-dependent methyltransferase
MSDKIINEINKYYSEKVTLHGATPQGVDWNGIESQENRFSQLIKVADIFNDNNLTLLDYGCGFGSLLTYLQKKKKIVNYIGYDISDEMLIKAKELNGKNGVWINEISKDFKADYVLASGLFNVMLKTNIGDWEKYILETLDLINQISIKGFAFNILTSYSDVEFMKEYLYYASPEKYFSICKTKYSKQVSLLHDYGLYEFTILVKK